MKIRKASPTDAAPIAACLLLAMETIVYQFIGKEDHAEALSLLQHFAAQPANQYSYQNCWVVVEDGEVVAAANLYDGESLHALRAPVLQYMHRHFNPAFVPEDETGPGEFYLDTIGVMDQWQGRGIGTQLLRFVIAEYVQRQHQTLGLLVAASNAGAQRLYQSLGFLPVGKRMVFGKHLIHLQLRPL